MINIPYNQAPKSWEIAPLEVIANFNSGITWKKSQELDKNEDSSFPVIRVGNVQDYLETDDLLYLLGITDEAFEKNKASKGSTIYVGSNGSQTRIGNAIYIDKDKDFLVASFLNSIKSNNEKKLLNEFLYYWFNSYNVQQILSNTAESTSGLYNLSQSLLEKLKISYPKLNVQKSIIEVAKFLDNINYDLREIIKKKILIKKRLINQIIQNNLSGKNKFIVRELNERESLNFDFVDNENNEWVIEPLSNKSLFSINSNKLSEKTSKDFYFNYIEIEGVNSKLLIKPDNYKIYFGEAPSRARKVLRNNDVVVCSVRPILQKNFHVSWDVNNDYICSTGFNVISCVSDIDGNLLKNIVFSDFFLRQMIAYESGTSYPAVSDQDFKKIIISLPKKEKTKIDIIEFLDKFESNLKYYVQLYDVYKRIKDNIISNLMNGKVESLIKNK